MKKYLILIFVFLNFVIFSQDNTGDSNNLTDDDYLNIDISNIIDNSKKEEKKENTKKTIEDAIDFNLSIEGRNLTEIRFLRNNLGNNNNVFGIPTFINRSYCDLQAGVNFGKIFQIYIDNSFRFSYDSNDIAHIKIAEHENKYYKYFEDIVKEAYLLWNIPIKYPIKILVGRSFFNPETSWVFLTANNLNYTRKTLGSFIDYDDIGVNMLKFSMYFPIVNFYLIYSPGSYQENNITKMFNIQTEQRFAAKVDFSFKKVNFNINGYIDTSTDSDGHPFPKWALGASISVNVTDELILYSDLALTSKERKLSLRKEDKKLYGNMNEYTIVENQKHIDFSGVLIGINYSPKAWFTVYGELYFNTNGLFPDEQKELFNNLEEVSYNYHNPEYPEFAPNANDIRIKIRKYYLDKVGGVAIKYDAFRLGAFYFFTQIRKENIASTGLDLSLSTFIHLFDGSSLIMPAIKYKFLKYFSVELISNLFLGYEKSLMGEMFYLGNIRLVLEAKF